ncbi:MAG: ferredoxin [Polaromonas sp.]|nr:ferredoxin [Polaromonas sp.]
MPGAPADPSRDAPTREVFCGRVAGVDVAFEAPADTPLLAAAEAAGVAMASSCRNGTCRTCLCRLLQGRVAYRIDWPGLSTDEKRKGFILPCVAYPLSDVVIEPAFPD